MEEGTLDILTGQERDIKIYMEVLMSMALTYNRRFKSPNAAHPVGLVMMDLAPYVNEKSRELMETKPESVDLRMIFEEMGLILTNRLGVKEEYQDIRKKVKLTYGGET